MCPLVLQFRKGIYEKPLTVLVSQTPPFAFWRKALMTSRGPALRLILFILLTKVHKPAEWVSRVLLWGWSPVPCPLETAPPSSGLWSRAGPPERRLVFQLWGYLAFPALVKFCLRIFMIATERNLENVSPLPLKVVTFAHICQRKCL